MALTRLDNLISSKTGKYLYVSPDDFNASDELNNRGNSPVRPFKSLQRAFLEISRFSYLPGGPDNDRFDQFTVMVMPGKHYVDNRPGLMSTDGIDQFSFDQALSEWTDNSNLDIGDPNNCLYKFNNTEGGAIIPRGSSIIGYDLRRTSVHPLYVPDPADRLEKRSAIFNVTGGCYFWQFTIRDGDLEPSSPLYSDGIGEVYIQNGNWSAKAVPNFSHHKLTVFEYADKEELSLYYQKVAKAFSQYQPTIDDPNEFGDRIQETRIVGPLSDIRGIDSIKCTDLTGSDTGFIGVEVGTKVNHGYFKGQFIAIENNGLDDEIDGTFQVNDIDGTDLRKFTYRIQGNVAGTLGLVSGQTYYTTTSGNIKLSPNATVKAEVDSVESASPYVFNCSIRSTWGICGIWANGLKATGFKSVVIAQYTGVSLQKDDRAFIRYDEYSNTFNQASLADSAATVPYHTKGDAFWKDDWRNFHVRASEDAFIQCVSIFAVGFADHFLMESGGDMSITNSNSNFGNTSLHAKGHKGYAFNQDKGGYVTDIVPPQIVPETTGNTSKVPYYTLDVQASNDPDNHTQIFLGDDLAYDPSKRPAASIEGYRIGAKKDDKVFVKLTPRSAGQSNEFNATISPSGFKRYVAAPSILTPSGGNIVGNDSLDAANLIEANKNFIAYEAYGYITSKYPNITINENIDIIKCRRDIGYLIDATVQDLRLGGNLNTIQAAESYYVATELSYITNELTETLEGYYYARDLAIAAARNFSYLRTGVTTTTGSSIINVGDTSGIVPGMTVADYETSSFTNGYLNSNATRPASPAIPNNTFVKKVIDSTNIELGQKATFSEKKVVSVKHGDAANLIEVNKDFIAAEAYERMLLDFPGYTSPAANYTPAKCKDDLVKAVHKIASDVAFGGNAETWDISYYYESGEVLHISTSRTETARAYEYVKDMAIQVMRKEDVFIYGTHGLTQTKTTSGLVQPIASPQLTNINEDNVDVVSDRGGDAQKLIAANKNLIAHEAVERMVSQSSLESFTPITGTTYDPATGVLNLKIPNNGLSASTSVSVTNAAYDPTTGILTLTKSNHGMKAGEKIQIQDEALWFKCSMDNKTSVKKYPRSTDPVSGKWLEITNVQQSTFDVHVGSTPIVSFTPTAADYNAATGVMTLTIGNHGLKAGTSIKLAQESLTFTCSKDSNQSNHAYPRTTDPFFNTAINIDSVTTTTITINVGFEANAAEQYAHTFVPNLPAGTGAVIAGGNYSHEYDQAASPTFFRAQDSIRLDFDALTFTCGMDNNATEHKYPRVSDPAASDILPVVFASQDDVVVNVGKTPQVTYDVTGANYNQVTGDIVLTINDHDLVKGSTIRLADGGLSFKCAKDSYTSTESYPRSTDPAYQTALEVKEVGSSYYKPTNAAYDPNTGVLNLTVSNHGLVNGNRIKISDNSLTFTCAMDNHATEHAYPRSSDPKSGEWLEISDVTPDTFNVNVGEAGAEFTFTAGTGTSYDPVSGDLVLNVGTHGLSVGDGIVIDNNSLKFNCEMDGNDSDKSYPRAGKDQASSRSLHITNITDDSITVNVGGAGTNKFFKPTAATYDPATGVMVATIGQHGLRVGSNIVLKDNSLKFTCTRDNDQTWHSYPRPGVDPWAGKSIAITAVGYNTKTATNAVYTPANGDLVITSSGHGFANGDYVKIADNSLKFTCELDGDVSIKSYPRPGFDYPSGRWLKVSNATGDTFTINVGSSSNTSLHSYDDAVLDGIHHQDGTVTFNVGFDSNTNNQYPHTFKEAVDNAIEYQPESTHTWKSSDPNSIKHLPKQAHIFKRSANNSIEKQSGTITVNVGAGDPADQYGHDFVPGSGIGAVITGGDYPHQWVSSVPDSVHKVFSVGGSNAYHNQDCVDDVVDILDAIGHNLAYGGNDKTWDAAYSYKTGAHVVGEETETNFVFEQAREMAAQVVRRQKILSVGKHGLVQDYNPDGSITEDMADPPVDRAGDARNLIESNKSLIAKEAYARMILQNPGFLPPTGNKQDCIDDIEDFITEVSYNVAFGGNDRVWDMANLYVTGAHVAGEETQTIMAMTDATEMMVQVMRQEKVLIIGDHGLTQSYDNTITVNVDTPQDNKVADAKNLILANKDFIAQVALGRMLDAYPSYQFTAPYTNADCLDDLRDVAEVVAHNLAYGGNDRVWDAANMYVAGAHAAGSENETIAAFNEVRDIINEVITNVDVTVGGHSSISQVKDTTITDGVSNNQCNSAKSTVTSLVQILTATIATPSSLAAVTRTQSVTRCEDIRSSINTLSAIATNAISNPVSLDGVVRDVSDATYDPTTGKLVLTIGSHSYTAGTKVNIAPSSIVFTCSRDGDATEHAYPRATDPSYKKDNPITEVTGTTITVNVGITSDTSVHAFVSAANGAVKVGGITRTESVGRCEDVKSSINTLFGILTNTVLIPTSLDSVVRTSSIGRCQDVASSISTLFGILTNAILNPGYIDSIDRTETPLGLAFGPSVTANASTSNSYVYFTLDDAVYTNEYSPSPDTSFNNSGNLQDNNYPKCANVSTAIRQYFSNIGTIIQTGLNSVPRNEPSSSSSDLASRGTIWTIKDPTSLTANPHNFETGTPIRLVPRAKDGVVVDKRKIRLPNGFSPNQTYYVIAPGRITKPTDFSTAGFTAGSTVGDQAKLMLAGSKENAAAGIYIHSAEVESVDTDIEIDLYQFVLDTNYDCHQYSCETSATPLGALKTDVPHIFDVPTSNVTVQEVFFKKNEGGSLPLLSQSWQQDPDVAVSSKLKENKAYFARYVDKNLFTIHKTVDKALSGQSPISFDTTTKQDGFSVFANKRESPLRYDPIYENPNTGTPPIYGKWFIQVVNQSENSSTPGHDFAILTRLHEQAYNDLSGIEKTNDAWFERIKDERKADDRIYRLRYVIPEYLQSVRDPLNGFTIKIRKDTTRKLLPQKIVLRPVVSGSNTEAKFYNPAQAHEWIGATKADLSGITGHDETLEYNPYRKPLSTVGPQVFTKTLKTSSDVDFNVESGRYFVDASDGNTYLELTTYDPSLTSTPALINEKFVTVSITVPQGGSFTANPSAKVNNPSDNGYNKVEWFGNCSGYAYVHAALNVPGTDTWHLILKGVVSDTNDEPIDYDPLENTRFEHVPAGSTQTVFADLKADRDYGKSFGIKDLIRKGYPEYYYKQGGAKVYTLTPGDKIVSENSPPIEYYIESVTDVGEIDDTFYIFDVEQIQKRIFKQQPGIYYLTAIRGDISPYPTGAGNQGNFRDFKFSQPISKLYPLNYKNDPFWFRQIDPAAVDPPSTSSAADNYTHGLVTVNDFKGSMTKECVGDILATAAFTNNSYSGNNELKAQIGNATSGSEDRLIPIAGDSTVVSDVRVYVELRRPSIARAGNHTFEYLGFGPGNYSTGLPQRQEVILEPIQDFYAQSKKQDGGLVFYTGLNSNGDLYIGNRKIDAITGEEEFLESAQLIDSDDDEEDIGGLVTTFDTPVTFNEYITVNGGDNQDKTSTFNSPVTINVLGRVRDYALKIISDVDPNSGDDGSLAAQSQYLNQDTLGHITIARNRIAASIFQFNPRGSAGAAQGYKIQNHAVGLLGSNITPNQLGTFNATQVVQYGNAGAPKSGDMLLKGNDVGKSGSLGWIYANYFTPITANQIKRLTFNGTQVVTVEWEGLKNSELGIASGSQIKITNFIDSALDGTWTVLSAGFDPSDEFCKFSIVENRANVQNQNPFDWSGSPTATMQFANSSWKEWGVLGSESIRTRTAIAGDYRVGINTIARADHAAYANAFVSDNGLAKQVNPDTNPRANLDVVGTAFISGKTFVTYDYNDGSPQLNNYAGTANADGSTRSDFGTDNALLVGGDAYDPNTSATLRVSTAAPFGGVGINTIIGTAPLDTTQTNTTLDQIFVVVGGGRFTDDVSVEQDLNIGSWPSGHADNTVNVTSGITTGTFNFLMGNTFSGTHVDNTGQTVTGAGLQMAGYAQNIEIGNKQLSGQNVEVGGLSNNSTIKIGATPNNYLVNSVTTLADSKIVIGGAYDSTESQSYTRIGTKSLIADGDVWIGGWPNGVNQRSDQQSVNLFTPAGTVNFFSNSGGPSNINFATNASDVQIAGQGGTTTVNNKLQVNASAKFLSDIWLCGGTSAFEFISDRGQLGTTISSHQNGLTPPYTVIDPNKNVDILNVLKKVLADTGEYNQIDTAGSGLWGGYNFQGTPAGETTSQFPDLTGTSEYYLPLKYAPITADINGNLTVQYFVVGDYILIDTGISGNSIFPEVVQITELTRTTAAPYFLKVKRQPFGTFTGFHSDHPDTTPIYKVNVQFDSTWTENDLDNTGPQDQVNLAEFGGTLSTDDYIIVGRSDTNSDGTYDFGEALKIAQITGQVNQKLTVSNCGEPDKVVFEVDSVTGEVTIGNPDIPGSIVNINTTIKLQGGCGTIKREEIIGDLVRVSGNLSTQYITNVSPTDIAKVSVGDEIRYNATHGNFSGVEFPINYVTEVRTDSIGLKDPVFGNDISQLGFYVSKNETLTLTNGNDQEVFDVDSCSANTTIGNHIRRLDISEFYPADKTVSESVNAFDPIKDEISIHSYWHDPVTFNNGKKTTVRGAVTAHSSYDWVIPVQSIGEGNGAFEVGDLLVVGDNTNTAPQIIDGSIVVVNPGFHEILIVRGITSGATPELICDGGQEGTTKASAGDYAINDTILAIKKHSEVSQLLDIASKQRGSVEYVSAVFNKGYIVQSRIDYVNYVRFENVSTGDNNYFIVNSNMVGTVNSAVTNHERQTGALGYNKGNLSIGGDINMIGGDIEIYDSVNSSRLFYFKNDGGHADHLGSMQIDAGVVLKGALTMYPENCPETVFSQTGVVDPTFTVDNVGNVAAKLTLTITGDDAPNPVSTDEIFSVNKLNNNGSDKFSIKHTGEIEAFGIDPFWTRSGGVHTRYVSTGSDAAAKTLTANLVYCAAVDIDSTLVLTLPSEVNTGDVVKVVDVGGNLNHRTSLVVRAPGVGVRVQGDSTGTTLAEGGGFLAQSYNSGELVIQTPNAAFSLVYLGSVDSAGGVGIPSTQQGWWLMEI